MKKLFALLAVTASLTAFGAAQAASTDASTTVKTSTDSDGSTTKTYDSKATDANGTATETSVKAKTDVNSNGAVSKDVTVDKTSDPKGLFNKSEDKTEVKTSANGHVMKKHKKVVNGKTVTNTSTNSMTNTTAQ